MDRFQRLYVPMRPLKYVRYWVILRDEVFIQQVISRSLTTQKYLVISNEASDLSNSPSRMRCNSSSVLAIRPVISDHPLPFDRQIGPLDRTPWPIQSTFIYPETFVNLFTGLIFIVWHVCCLT